MENEIDWRNKEEVKEYNKKYGKEWRRRNPEKIEKERIKFKKKHPNYYNEYMREYRKNNPEYTQRAQELTKNWNKKNKDKVKKYDLKRKYNPQRIKWKKEYGKNYREKNKEHLKEYFKTPKIKKMKKNYYDNRRKNDNDFKIKLYLRNRVNFIINKYTKTGKIYSSKKYGIDYESIIEYLKPLPEDMSLYHIHHVKPLFTFNFMNKDDSTNLEEVKKAFAPENHKLLLIKEHKKLNHYKLSRVREN